MCSNFTVTIYRNKDQCVQTSLSQYTGTRINVFKLHCHNIQEQGSMCSNFSHNIQEQGSMCSKLHCHNIQEQGSMCSNFTVTIYKNKDQCVQTSLSQYTGTRINVFQTSLSQYTGTRINVFKLQSQYTGTRINVFKLHCHNIQEQGSMCSKPHCHNIQEQESMCSNLTVTYRNKDQCVQTSLSHTGTRINVFKLHCHIQEQGSMCSNFTVTI